MSFFAVLFALLLEQARPLSPGNALHAALRAWARWSSRNLDAGRAQHGWLAWSVAVLGPSLLAFAIHWLLWSVHGLLAFAWSVAVLYASLGFRQFSHHFTAIRDALDVGDEETARQLLADTQMPVQRIAESLRFSSAANFATAFRRWTGESPGQWRRRRR